MKNRHFNVRISENEFRQIEDLRDRGINMSDEFRKLLTRISEIVEDKTASRK